MAIVVEDGTGLAAANSYASIAEANAYFLDRANAAWDAAEDDARSAALIRATTAIDGVYGSRWPGFRCMELQGLDWPRYEAWDRDGYPLTGLPKKVKEATCEAALIELGSSGALSKKADIGLSELTVGSITKKWAVASGAGATAYPAIKQALSRIVRGGSGIQLSRG